jgi:HNH endonuclease
VSWKLHFGAIPDNMHVLHKCDDPACVAPHHLFLGTHRDNMLDKEAKGRANSPIGARNRSSKLTVDMVREIKASQESQVVLAERYRVTDGAINHIKMGRTWKHVV